MGVHRVSRWSLTSGEVMLIWYDHNPHRRIRHERCCGVGRFQSALRPNMFYYRATRLHSVNCSSACLSVCLSVCHTVELWEIACCDRRSPEKNEWAEEAKLCLINTCSGSCARRRYKTFFRSVVVAKLTYAGKRQRLVELYYGNWSTASGGSYPPGCMCLRSGLCRSYILTAAELTEDIDEWRIVLWDKNHILHALPPDCRLNLVYKLRPRSHDREIGYQSKLLDWE